MNITIGFGQRNNVEDLRSHVLGWPVDAQAEDDALHTTRHLVAVTADGDIVGAVSCSLIAFPNGDGANFGNSRAVRFWGLAVAEPYRGRGVGTQLMDAVVTRARDLDARIVWAHTRTSAISFYEQMGFDAFGVPTASSITGLDSRRVALNLAGVPTPA
jgi:GNAT superfamily N-acetyltransferase